jgi:hypothetical protein
MEVLLLVGWLTANLSPGIDPEVMKLLLDCFLLNMQPQSLISHHHCHSPLLFPLVVSLVMREWERNTFE